MCYRVEEAVARGEARIPHQRCGVISVFSRTGQVFLLELEEAIHVPCDFYTEISQIQLSVIKFTYFGREPCCCQSKVGQNSVVKSFSTALLILLIKKLKYSKHLSQICCFFLQLAIEGCEKYSKLEEEEKKRKMLVLEEGITLYIPFDNKSFGKS